MGFILESLILITNFRGKLYMILIYSNKDSNKILLNVFGELEICSLNCPFKLLNLTIHFTRLRLSLVNLALSV